MVFTLPQDLLKFSERKLTNKLLELYHQQLKGRLPESEATRLGEQAIRAAFKEDMELFNKSAKAQGFKEVPIRIDETRLNEQLEKWRDAVRRTEKLRSGDGSQLPRPPS